MPPPSYCSPPSAGRASSFSSAEDATQALAEGLPKGLPQDGFLASKLAADPATQHGRRLDRSERDGTLLGPRSLAVRTDPDGTARTLRSV